MSPPGQTPPSPGDPAHILHGASPSHSQKDSGKGSEDGDSIFSVKGISSKIPLAAPWLALCRDFARQLKHLYSIFSVRAHDNIDLASVRASDPSSVAAQGVQQRGQTQRRISLHI